MYYVLSCDSRVVGIIESEQRICGQHWHAVTAAYASYLAMYLKTAVKAGPDLARNAQLRNTAPPESLLSFACARLGAKTTRGDVLNSSIDLPYGTPSSWLLPIFNSDVDLVEGGNVNVHFDDVDDDQDVEYHDEEEDFGNQ